MRMLTFNGVEIHLHWTLGGLGLGFMMSVALAGSPQATLLVWAAFLFVLGMGISLVAHGAAHWYIAAQAGASPTSLLLVPWGGTLTYDQQPESPNPQFQIAIAGPVASFLLAGFLFAVAATGIRTGVGATNLGSADLILQLAWGNLWLGGLNLLPVFPLDGGAALKALLTRNRTAVEATRLVARVGRWAALLVLLGAVYSRSWGLVCVAAFFVGAGVWETFREQFRFLVRSTNQGQTWAAGSSSSSYSSVDGHSGSSMEPLDDEFVVEAVEVRRLDIEADESAKAVSPRISTSNAGQQETPTDGEEPNSTSAG